MQKPTNVYYGDLTDSPMPYTSYSPLTYYASDKAVVYPQMYGKCFSCDNNAFLTVKNNAYDCGSGFYTMVPLMKGEPCCNKNYTGCKKNM